MSKVEIQSGKEPIRLFESDFLEFFTHIHPAVVLAIWLPVVGDFLARAVMLRSLAGGWLHILLGFVAGLAVHYLILRRTEGAAHDER